MNYLSNRLRERSTWIIMGLGFATVFFAPLYLAIVQATKGFILLGFILLALLPDNPIRDKFK